MQILIYNHNVAWSGGTFFRALYFARGLARRGHGVVLVTISPKRRFGFSEYMYEGVRVIESPDLLWGIGRTGWDPWDTACRVIRTAASRADLIHAFDCRPAVILPALLASRVWRRPLVIDWADWWGRGGTISERPYRAVGALFGQVETFFEEAFRTRADASTVISKALGGRARGLGVPPQTIHRIPQGCDTEGIQPIAKAEARQKLGLPPDWRLVGHLGVLLRRDAQLLFDAASSVLEQEKADRLVLIGKHTATLPPTLTMPDRAIETGYVRDGDLPYWLAACDVVTLPLVDSIASRGRWPSKGNAYLAAGRPIVATRVGDFAEVVAEADVGILTEATAAAFANGLCQALASEDAHERWGRNGHRVAAGPLSWPTLTAQLERVYTTLVS